MVVADGRVLKFFDVEVRFAAYVRLHDVRRFHGDVVCIFAGGRYIDEVVVAERSQAPPQLMARRVPRGSPETFDASSLGPGVVGYMWTDGAGWWLSTFIVITGRTYEVAVECDDAPSDPRAAIGAYVESMVPGKPRPGEPGYQQDDR